MEQNDNLEYFLQTTSKNEVKIEGKKEDGPELDEHGKIIHEDLISFPIKQKELIFIHETIREILDKGLVPVDDIGPCISLLEDLASMESIVSEEGHLTLPVNYFVGMWHCLNTARKFSIYSQQWKRKDKLLDSLTHKVAEQIDNYHKVKSHELNEDKMDKDPNYFLKNIPLNLLGE